MIISVVVITLGKTPVLARCAQGIAQGTRVPHELVLVDQSEAGVHDRVEQALGDTAVQLRCVRATGLGVSRARNLGASRASGDHLAFTDDDCVPDVHWLRALAASIGDSGADAATGRVLPLEDGRPGLVAVSSRTDTRARLFRGDHQDVPWDLGTGGNMLVARALFERVGGFDEEFGPGGRFRAAEDIEFLQRVVGSGAILSYTPDAVVFHEMKTRSARLGRRIPYGFGIGGLVSRAPSGRRALLARRYSALQTRAFISGVRSASPRRIVEPLVSSASFAAGLLVGARNWRR